MTEEFDVKKWIKETHARVFEQNLNRIDKTKDDFPNPTEGIPWPVKKIKDAMDNQRKYRIVIDRNLPPNQVELGISRDGKEFTIFFDVQTAEVALNDLENFRKEVNRIIDGGMEQWKAQNSDPSISKE